MKIIGIIPSRFGSSRFPGKPLAEIKGKTMIQRVYEQAQLAKSLSAVFVATDDQRIVDEVNSFNGKVIFTSTEHKSGTDRCNEVIEKLNLKGNRYDVVVNIQGDEPYINPKQINQVSNCFNEGRIEIATLVKKITKQEELFNSNINKVVFDQYKKAMYFSRHPIPFQQGIEKSHWLTQGNFYKHIGIYGYRADVLHRISTLPVSSLEKAESLEQLRWMENGFSIHIEETGFESIAVDTPEDLSKFSNII
ncbi:MAG: 3-deoxy-manno-octulosonate cytidylyltransferase [Bacteroidales bacterium]|nr:3-deoxy-manno-octulosonate cytidylyltransferase [Bacteroidales bacterium]MCF8403656.1 3-deoxy-manno-octulosonate cytidylyltransferase [Bacteroidales bacterium]